MVFALDLRLIAFPDSLHKLLSQEGRAEHKYCACQTDKASL